MIASSSKLRAFLALGPAFAATAAASAERLPFRGAFGAVAENGCRSYREQSEGHYIETYDNGRGYSATGECGCDVTDIHKDRPIGLSPEHDVPVQRRPDRRRRTGHRRRDEPGEIRIDGRRYVRCK